MRVFVPLFALGVVAACSPNIPNSAAGFDSSPFDPQPQSTLVEGQTINGDPLVPPAAVSSEPLTTAQAPLTALAPAATAPAVTSAAAPATVASGTSDDIARETAAALSAAQSNSGVAPLEASPANPPPQPLSNPGISDENDFAAVSGRETIESDAERIAQNKAQYLVVQPTDVPTRSGSDSPNIVSYALQTSNPRGTRVFTRAGINLQAKMQRNCAGYPSPDQAQIAFLSKGGPERDRMGLDPDGDGYACSWDPAPFRTAVKN
jgi:hypothetical protein